MLMQNTKAVMLIFGGHIQYRVLLPGPAYVTTKVTRVLSESADRNYWLRKQRP